MDSNFSKTWANLRKYYACHDSLDNPFYEPFTRRRYNPIRSDDSGRIRLVFLNRTIDKYPDYRTLVRKGRPVWCENLSFEGTKEGQRFFGFSLKGGKKRFTVSDSYCFLLPSRLYVFPSWPSKLGSSKSICSRLGTVFGYPPAIKMMYNRIENSTETLDEFSQRINSLSPYKPGTLVSPRLGLFRPMHNDFGGQDKEFPYGLIIRREQSKYQELYGRELFTVSFGQYMVENVHPIEMEIINDNRKEI